MLKPDWKSVTNVYLSAKRVLQDGTSRPDDKSTCKIPSSSTEVGYSGNFPDAAELMALQQQLITDIAKVDVQICEEQESVKDEELRARERQHDFGPMIHAWLNMLSKKDHNLLKDMMG